MANWNKLKIIKIATIPNNKFIIYIKCLRIMEIISNFILSNQFLIQIAKKVFTYYDFEFVLTEYNKKKIRSLTKKQENIYK